jgi:clan AA aspartic protease (TIGR02281 family)
MLPQPSGIFIFVTLFLHSSAGLGAEFYRWMDQNGVVHFTDNLHNIPEKQRTTATRIQGKEPARGPEPPAPLPPKKASIPIEKQGQVIIVEAMLNQKTSARFVVDTGASYTMISSGVAKLLDIDISQHQPTVSFQTANGIIQAPLAKLDSITVGGMEIKDLTAAIHDIAPESRVAGLLGLNFLSNFRMDIDTQKGVLHLEKK